MHRKIGITSSALIKAKMRENNNRVHHRFQCTYNINERLAWFSERDSMQDATWDKVKRRESCESRDTNMPPGNLDNKSRMNTLLKFVILDMQIGADKKISSF